MPFFSLIDILSSSPLFTGLGSIELKKLKHLIFDFPLISLQKSMPINTVEGSIFFICRGEMEVVAKDYDGKNRIIEKVVAGQAWTGVKKVAEYKSITLSFSPKAIVKQLRISDLYYQANYRRIYFKLCQVNDWQYEKFSTEHLSTHNEINLLNEAELERRVATTQVFVTGILLLICLYIAFLNISELVVAKTGTTIYVTISFLLLCLGLYIWIVRNSHCHPSVLGLTLANTPGAVKQALVSAPFLLLVALVFKYLATHLFPSLHGHPLIDVSGAIKVMGGENKYLISAMVYTFLSVPLQELIFRGGFQGCLQIIFSDNRSIWPPILLTNLVFAATHITISPLASLVIFFPGLYWGWLFAKYHNLIGVCISHAIFGTTAFFLIGYLDVLRV